MEKIVIFFLVWILLQLIGSSAAQTCEYSCSVSPPPCYNYFSAQPDIAWWDQFNTETPVCCNFHGCVGPDGQCYQENTSTTFTSQEYDKVAWCNKEDWKWYDLDTDIDLCDKSGLNWTYAGEYGVGEYSGPGSPGCCGDDRKEYYVTQNCSEISYRRCCSDPDDKIDLYGNCVSSCEITTTTSTIPTSSVCSHGWEYSEPTINLLTPEVCPGEKIKFSVENIRKVCTDGVPMDAIPTIKIHGDYEATYTGNLLSFDPQVSDDTTYWFEYLDFTCDWPVYSLWKALPGFYTVKYLDGSITVATSKPFTCGGDTIVVSGSSVCAEDGITVNLIDPSGNVVYQKNTTPDVEGRYSVDLPIPLSAPKGMYKIEAKSAFATAQTQIEVGSCFDVIIWVFGPSIFELGVKTPITLYVQNIGIIKDSYTITSVVEGDRPQSIGLDFPASVDADNVESWEIRRFFPMITGLSSPLRAKLIFNVTSKSDPSIQRDTTFVIDQEGGELILPELNTFGILMIFGLSFFLYDIMSKKIGKK